MLCSRRYEHPGPSPVVYVLFSTEVPGRSLFLKYSTRYPEVDFLIFLLPRS